MMYTIGELDQLSIEDICRERNRAESQHIAAEQYYDLVSAIYRFKLEPVDGLPIVMVTP